VTDLCDQCNNLMELNGNVISLSYHLTPERMDLTEGLMIHMFNLISTATLLFLAVERDMAIHYVDWFNHMPVHTSQLSGQQWVDKHFVGHDRRFHNETQ